MSDVDAAPPAGRALDDDDAAAEVFFAIFGVGLVLTYGDADFLAAGFGGGFFLIRPSSAAKARSADDVDVIAPFDAAFDAVVRRATGGSAAGAGGGGGGGMSSTSLPFPLSTFVSLAGRSPSVRSLFFFFFLGRARSSGVSAVAAGWAAAVVDGPAVGWAGEGSTTFAFFLVAWPTDEDADGCEPESTAVASVAAAFLFLVLG